MFLVRSIHKTGHVQVYVIDGVELAAHGKTRKRRPRAWTFNKGIAAVDESVAGAMLAIEKEARRATLDSGQ